MTIDQLLEEFDLTLDDVRWYLAGLAAKRLLAYRDREFELIHYIWTGRLEDELYHMAERFLEDLKLDIERGHKDDARLRELFQEIDAARIRRYSEGGS